MDRSKSRHKPHKKGTKRKGKTRRRKKKRKQEQNQGKNLFAHKHQAVYLRGLLRVCFSVYLGERIEKPCPGQQDIGKCHREKFESIGFSSKQKAVFVPADVFDDGRRLTTFRASAAIPPFFKQQLAAKLFRTNFGG